MGYMVFVQNSVWLGFEICRLGNFVARRFIGCLLLFWSVIADFIVKFFFTTIGFCLVSFVSNRAFFSSRFLITYQI